MKTLICNDTLNISALLKAKAMLDHAITVAESPLEKTGAIQCFQYCYELSWKTMKRILAYQGVLASSPRETFRLAAKANIIADPAVWFTFITQRNLAAHTYDATLAEEVFDFLSEFQQELTQFLHQIQSL